MTGTKKGAKATWDYNRRQRLVNAGKASKWVPKMSVGEAIMKAGI
jgi:hypothetical protein